MRSIGRYELLGEIGRGGMGIVYMARQRDLDRLVALKELNGDDANVPELTKRFARESHLGGSLNHPNIVTVHDYFDEGETAYIAMEYLPGGSLRPRVGRLSLAQITGVLQGLLAGLAAVEPAQIVHRDLKPENVLVSADGRVKIADFGIAKTNRTVSALSFMTSTGMTVGTPAYMAPEQALSDEIGPWTDLYSVGVIAYEQLVGRVPFHDSKSSIEFLLRRDKEPAVPVSQSRPDLNPALSEWVARLLIRDPAERTHSATEAWEQLEEIALETLGPRWHRDARLPPLSQPEAESGFHSYGREPTAAEDKPPRLSSEPPASSSSASARRSPQSLRSQSQSSNIPSGSSLKNDRPTAGGRIRQLRRYLLTAALTVTAGFAIAFLGASTKAPAHPRGPSAATTTSGPSRAYVTALSTAVSRLNGARATASAELDHAKTAIAQAAAAERLARAHDQAATTIRSARPGPAERTTNIAIVTALTHLADGYSTMAKAARSENRPAFDNNRKTVNVATAALVAGLAQLHQPR
jgi:serine/threonine protein kinase